MTSKPDPIPDGYGTVTPWIVGKDTAGLIEFLKEAFGAEEIGRVEGAEPGSIGHAEVRIGTSIVMMFDTPFKVDTPAMMRLYVEDADAVFQSALGAGSTAVTPMTDVQAWGERIGRVRDPFGHLWWIHERVEEVASEEALQRMQEPKYLKSMEQTQVMNAPGLV